LLPEGDELVDGAGVAEGELGLASDDEDDDDEDVDLSDAGLLPLRA
jgi:hypothetical protein